MNDRRDRATRAGHELVQMVADKVSEIIKLLDEVEQKPIWESASKWGLEVYVKGRERPVVVPDYWVSEWITFADGNTDFVVGKVRELGRWSSDNPKRRKYEKNIRSWLGSIIARDYAKIGANRKLPSNDLSVYERKHND